MPPPEPMPERTELSHKPKKCGPVVEKEVAKINHKMIPIVLKTCTSIGDLPCRCQKKSRLSTEKTTVFASKSISSGIPVVKMIEQNNNPTFGQLKLSLPGTL